MQKKKKKSLGQGMEAHNSIKRGSWTHVHNKVKYVQQTN
jgi:IS1 family transposase